MSELIQTQESGWLHIVLNRPAKKNALNLKLIQQLTQVFADSQNRKKIKGVVLKGKGSCFCSGADLKWINSANSSELEQLFDLFQTIADFPLPAAAYAHGAVFGGGIGLLSVCDFVFVHSQTQFCFSELKLGLMPALIAPFVLKKAPLLKNRFLSSLSFDAKTALQTGLADSIGSEKEFPEWRSSLQAQLQSVNLQAFQETKKFLKQMQSIPENQIKSCSIQCLNKRKKDPLTVQKITQFLKKDSR